VNAVAVPGSGIPTLPAASVTRVSSTYWPAGSLAGSRYDHAVEVPTTNQRPCSAPHFAETNFAYFALNVEHFVPTVRNRRALTVLTPEPVPSAVPASVFGPLPLANVCLLAMLPTLLVPAVRSGAAAAVGVAVGAAVGLVVAPGLTVPQKPSLPVVTQTET
jgi:hypothetical protein